jgi:hypothetical protein
MKKHLLLFCLIGLTLSLSARTTYTIDASREPAPLKEVTFNMGHPGPTGKEIRINSQYLTIGGKPAIPVMGEVHYTRIPREYWEETLLKMKAAGVHIVALYIFWNHHEELEGQFNWTGNNDLRAFIKLCQKHHLYAYPRLGPWAHGEARNGGTPDWILRKQWMKDRSNHPVYQRYVKRFFHEIGLQLHGLYYKDGGPIIGAQLENEYWRGKAGEAHILWLKQTARDEGIDVPLYTVTGWQNASVPALEVIPLWGAYPDAPWASHIHQEISEENFCFDHFRDNEKIGDNVIQSGYRVDYSSYPYFTCEMGIGIQNTYHRRLIIGPKDGLVMVIAKLGSGSNLIGYYMFAGGSNPQGILHTQTEDQEETGYWNRNPEKSYDFQAAIRETGETSPAYREVKKCHYFLRDFGKEMAPAVPVIPPKRANDLQVAVRVNGHAGFLFGINYCRYLPRAERKNVQFEIKLPDGALTFPQQEITIPDSTVFIWPFNLKLGGVTLRYATAQPLCKLGNTFVFFAQATIKPEFCLEAAGISTVSMNGKNLTAREGKYTVVVNNPGKEAVIKIKSSEGTPIRVLVLSEAEANQAWVFDKEGKKTLYLSAADLLMEEDRLRLITKCAVNELYQFEGKERITVEGKPISGITEGLFTRYEVKAPMQPLTLQAEPKPLLADAQWLQSSTDSPIPESQALFHRFFMKEFSLENPSRIRSAKLYLATEADCRLNVNNRFVSQPINPLRINEIDITGYVDKGDNRLYLDFPLTDGSKAFAARLIIEYANTQRVELTTDQSWLTNDLYSYPSDLKPLIELKEPHLVSAPTAFVQQELSSWKEWSIAVPFDLSEQAHGTYISLSYIGDRGRMYVGHQLVADHFNDNQPWRVALNRFDVSPEGRSLQLIIEPSHNNRLFQDKPTPPADLGKAYIRSLKAEQDYSITIVP